MTFNFSLIKYTMLFKRLSLQMRRQNNERTKYFPETYGKITGLKERVGSRDRVVEFESEETSSVMVYLEISADDLILVYNRYNFQLIG